MLKRKIVLTSISGDNDQFDQDEEGEYTLVLRKQGEPTQLAHPSFSDITDLPTLILPAITVGHRNDGSKESEAQADETSGVESQIALLRKLVTSSGIYALASVAGPLTSLLLAPFLTHNLSLSDYGGLALINTVIGLAVGITQMGLFSAFFRAYNYDYHSRQERDAVIATVTALLCLISFPFTLLVVLLESQLATLLFGSPGPALDLALAGGVILLQNLTVPGLALLRAESRPVLYSLVAVSNPLVTFLATLLLVGPFHGGMAGAIIGNGLGYACIVIVTLPYILWKYGLKVRLEIAKNLLSFGLPLIANFLSYWILQLSDRYLLSRFTSLAETAKYSVAYALGSILSVVVISPFTLAWPTILFSIAKRKDAASTFRIVFRMFSMLLLLSAFVFSFAAVVLLDWFFPASYRSATNIIPFVTDALVFYGLYFIFMVGANIKRKTWIAPLCMAIAAITNIILNFILIPLCGSLGAAVATMVAFLILALGVYIANQRFYPIPFEIGRFICAQLIGVGLYLGCIFLCGGQSTYANWGIYLGGAFIYAACLAFLGKLLPWKRSLLQKRNKEKVAQK